MYVLIIADFGVATAGAITLRIPPNPSYRAHNKMGNAEKLQEPHGPKH